MDHKDWKQFFREMSKKKDSWLILLLTGILLVVIALPVTEKKETRTSEKKETETAESGEDVTESTRYARQMEKRLEEVLTQVKGVGRVSVMITLSSSAEKVVEKDKETSSEEGGSRASETSVYAGGGGDEVPYVKQEISPGVEGVLVIADGGADAVVIENITEAVQALFGVDTHKIKVMKRN